MVWDWTENLEKFEGGTSDEKDICEFFQIFWVSRFGD